MWLNAILAYCAIMLALISVVVIITSVGLIMRRTDKFTDDEFATAMLLAIALFMGSIAFSGLVAVRHYIIM